MTSLGDRIRARREQLNMTQAQLADKIGVKIATISRYESGSIPNPPQERLAALIDALKVDANYLMDWDNNDEVNTDALREKLRRQPSMRILFDAAYGATEEQLMNFVKVIKALRDDTE